MFRREEYGHRLLDRAPRSWQLFVFDQVRTDQVIECIDDLEFPEMHRFGKSTRTTSLPAPDIISSLPLSP